MTRRTFGKAIGMAAAAAQSGNAAPSDPVNIGTRRELFIDREMVVETNGVDLRLATPVDGGPALQLDRPWERSFSNYTTILQEGSTYRLYYRGTAVAKDGGGNEVTCYAESSYGICWS